MRIEMTTTDYADIKGDILVFLLSKQMLQEGLVHQRTLPFTLEGALKDDFHGEAGESQLLYTEHFAGGRILLLGIGEACSMDDWRKAAKMLGSRCVDLKVTTMVVDCVSISQIASGLNIAVASAIAALLVDVQLGAYRFDRLKSRIGKKDDVADDKKLSTIILVGDDVDQQEIRVGIKEGDVIASGKLLARELVNLPGNFLSASGLADAARESAVRNGYAVKVMDKREIAELGMGGLLAVNKGSDEPPTFTVLEYVPVGTPVKSVALVGKGVTFDSGGISLKPSENMGEMKSDMAGAACVIGVLEAVAQLQLPVRVIGVIPATDNMPDGKAQQPGDVITTYSGITVEVSNTDAEGRLILADALHYVKRQYAPDIIIDIATLTGACIVALGYNVAAMLSNDDELAERLFEAGIRSGEKVWRLPLWNLYDEQIKSDVADVNNTGGRGAGTITAAKFLERFIDKHEQWAHLDIAGPAFASRGAGKDGGATGFGVGLLVDFLKALVS